MASFLIDEGCVRVSEMDFFLVSVSPRMKRKNFNVRLNTIPKFYIDSGETLKFQVSGNSNFRKRFSSYSIQIEIVKKEKKIVKIEKRCT